MKELTLSEKLIYALQKLEKSCNNQHRKDNIKRIKKELIEKEKN